jgi:cytokinin dehydrogenase
MVSRRAVLSGLGAAAFVLGFDPVTRSWISEAHAATFDHVPPLDGQLLTDPASLAPYGEDVGKIIFDTPVAVLLPGSVQDIQKMVLFCRRHGIKIAPRGEGHTTFGQSQVAGGLSIDMRTLNKIHSISHDSADVDAGAKWSSLVEATTPLGLTVPSLTGYLDLTLGGVLSVGGVTLVNTRGAVVDNVRELEVVTGAGEIVRCSPLFNRDLFDAVLAGLGQCAIMTRVIVNLIPVQAQSRTFLLNYTDNATFFHDFRTLLSRGEFDAMYNICTLSEAGTIVYQLNAFKNFDPATPPDNTHLLRGLSFDVATSTNSDSTYLAQIESVDGLIDFLISIGLFTTVIHPWFDVLLPDSKVESYVGEVLPSLTEEDIGPTGFVLLFALKHSMLKRPLFRVPSGGEYVWLFDILTSSAAPGPDPAFTTQMLTRNRTLFEKARALGGTRYPIGSVEFSHQDWRIQYGEVWEFFKAAKHRFDPDLVLSPGPGIF